MKAPDVKATADNLKAAIEGETYERDTMYPAFIKDARAAGNADAVRTFNFALSAEGGARQALRPGVRTACPA